MYSVQSHSPWLISNDHWIPNTPDDQNSIDAPVIITTTTSPDLYRQHSLSVNTDDLLRSPDSSSERPHSPGAFTYSSSPSSVSYMTQSPERGKQRLHISHQDKDGNNDTRIMMFSPDEDKFSSLITRIQHKLNDPTINRLKYLSRDGIEIVVGDDEDLEVALYLEVITQESRAAHFQKA
ncbi:hypothetical protein K450DRAFT_240543 [Umbelopsis ramanniana AG]|uniref:PB1 domain-containing protein n=1 Tax=Umbelopsis ramanniana AG TaxID=1314678 RepID=A0AAD5EBG1_UMBRA|nr:uncharacterized protein K450DRAFT_240543 [Umbelopsis ramanniana AG]KAI8579830.1 hypothetical protein K450DRAFT_240543 [Umbelopsis ramanniana AG]